MKIVFLKPHLDWNPGQEVEMDDGIAAYLIKTGVATNEEADPEEIEKTLHKKLKAAKPESSEHETVKSKKAKK